MSAPVFGVFFVGATPPITDQSFSRVDPTHWVLDVKASVPNYESLKEISLFQLQQLDPAAALGLYISVGGAEWQYRGFVSNRHPSEVMPLQWPPASPMVQNTVQLGVSVETEAELVQKEGSKLAGRQEFAKRVAMNLFHFMESYSTSGAGDHLVLPTNALERWFIKFDEKFKRDPDFLMHGGEKS